MSIGTIFAVFFINPITNLLIGFYHLLIFLHAPYPLGFAIILLTIAIRLILWPFVSSQLRSAQKMQRVTPHISHVKEKHKNDKKKQQEEIMRLYREHGVNPAAGCLPVIIQLPIIWSLYNVLTHIVNATSSTAINKVNEILYWPFLKITKAMWYTDFLGLPLAASPQKLLASHPYIILVPIITGLLQFILSKMMLPEIAPKKTKSTDDFQTAFQTQSVFIFPAMIGFFSLSLPLGMSLYWNTFTLFGILQQYLLIGPGGAKTLFKFFSKK